MKSENILRADYLDLIFAHRNKQYGGYELRKHYNSRALKALGITCLLLLLGIGIPVLLGKTKPVPLAGSTVVRDVEIHSLDIPKTTEAPKPPEHKASVAPSVANTVRSVTPEIVPNHLVKPDMEPPTPETLDHAVAGPVTNPGNGGDNPAATVDKPEGPAGSGDRTGHSAGGDAGNEPPQTIVDEMPEFPGGVKALMAYLQKNLSYPAAARADEIQGKVLIRFVVGIDGKIEQATVLRGIGGGCEKEALRVVNAMPRWKPGRQNGHNVKVYYSLPVSFRLN
ncbi:energy transducer TonB [Taibaiella koreensis]|uniref:energy transducer TonB n=1 Tax=Taibaiella koreensis TaxID=1268548 RepID=UPI000E5A0E82|nr:energy transducer TonB [Taibaiella koreensis]